MRLEAAEAGFLARSETRHNTDVGAINTIRHQGADRADDPGETGSTADQSAALGAPGDETRLPRRDAAPPTVRGSTDETRLAIVGALADGRRFECKARGLSFSDRREAVHTRDAG
ncbi:MAG: hypothetical protein V5A27_09140 [Halapricum sp.]